MAAEYNKAKFLANKPTFDIIDDNDIRPTFEYKKPKKKTLDNLLSG